MFLIVLLTPFALTPCLFWFVFPPNLHLSLLLLIMYSRHTEFKCNFTINVEYISEYICNRWTAHSRQIITIRILMKRNLVPKDINRLIDLLSIYFRTIFTFLFVSFLFFILFLPWYFFLFSSFTSQSARSFNFHLY